jgi:hypothetical protein
MSFKFLLVTTIITFLTHWLCWGQDYYEYKSFIPSSEVFSENTPTGNASLISIAPLGDSPSNPSGYILDRRATDDNEFSNIDKDTDIPNRFFSSTLASNGKAEPLPPTLDLVTVNPFTGTVSLIWRRPNPNPLFPDPERYVIYRRTTDELGNSNKFAIDTVDANTFTYTDNTIDAAQGSVSYSVGSYVLTGRDVQSAEHFTMFLKAEYDSCRNELKVNWTSYVGWGNRVQFFKVYLGTSPIGESFILVDSLPGTRNETAIKIPPNGFFYLYLEGKKDDRNVDLITTSNLTSISTRVSRPPAYIYIDSIVAGDRQIELLFSIDNTTEYKDFRITRWEQADSIRSIFSSRTLFRFSDPNTSFFSDTTDSWTTRSRRFFYKIDAYDGCERIKRQSNLMNSMILRIFTRAMLANLSWERYYSAKNNDIRYKIYRIAFAPEPLIPELIFDEVNPSDSTFSDNLSAFSGLGYQPQFCYFLEAYELGVPSLERLVRSRTVCTDVTPEVVMPNAIDPMSNIIRNGIPRNTLTPTISFESDYKLIIYNRWGGIVYEGVNQGWNGRLPDGSFAKEGTYIYRLEVYPVSKRTISKNGYLTVMYGPQ